MRLLLASSSPRRADLLASAGYAFDVAPADVDETPRPDEAPETYVVRLAADKAAAVARTAANRVVLAADTVVVVDGELFGKPRDDTEAGAMLRRLSGQEHEVLTGVAMRWRGRSAGGVDRTRVHLVDLRAEQIASYIRTGEPRDKAGAYAIQGGAADFVDRIEGAYSNVVGLPLGLVRKLLEELGVTTAGTVGDGGKEGRSD
ncbi:MAG: Maf family protein [Vicinamibacterales bacterium]|jgi:septum formation protein|nr:septum formation inhibitor Maf [Acidobacteriota bacterium]MDP6373773.1 Maf family protein [Vicinamibacterales bacterium]MDP6608227.1 Maf family protein [Vicinamibacterales bacterium]HAK55189.1 septum formation inhibitor Maf [Acidobacteriota bacterium]